MPLFGNQNPVVKRLLDRIEGLSEQLAEKRGEQEGLNLLDRIKGLREEISDLEISRDGKQEEVDRREREITHKVGLEKKRSEFEQGAAKREAVLEVREEALSAGQERFNKEMEFQRSRFEEEVGYLKGLMGEILERLPTVTVDRQIGHKE